MAGPPTGTRHPDGSITTHLRTGNVPATIRVTPDGRVEIDTERHTTTVATGQTLRALTGTGLPWLATAEAIEAGLAIAHRTARADGATAGSGAADWQATAHQIVTLARRTSPDKGDLVRRGHLQPWAWAVLAHDPASSVRIALARAHDPYADVIPPQVTDWLARDPDDYVRTRLAENLHGRPDLLIRLATDPAKDVRLNVANNPETPLDTRLVLATDPAVGVRRALARHQDLPAVVLDLFAADTHEMLRIDAAGHPCLSVEAIATLATDRRAGVRAVVAERPDLTDDLLLVLAEDRSVQVRLALARRRARINPTALDLLIGDAKDATLRLRLADREDLLDRHIRALAADTRREIRAAIATRHDLPSDVIAVLARDRTQLVRDTIAARHPHAAQQAARRAPRAQA